MFSWWLDGANAAGSQWRLSSPTRQRILRGRSALSMADVVVAVAPRVVADTLVGVVDLVDKTIFACSYPAR